MKAGAAPLGPLILLIILSGCSHRFAKGAKKAEPPPPNPMLSIPVNFGPSKLDQFGGPNNREQVWTVLWNAAKLHPDTEVFAMDLVHGAIYEHAKTASRFRSDTGFANRKSSFLKLRGNVQVVGIQPPVTLTCDEVDYDGKIKIAKARGHVQVVGPMGTLTGMQELWTSPDLSKIATPDVYRQ